MRILLIGYGKMGKTLEKLAIQKGHTISGIVDVDTNHLLDGYLDQSDVAIEFTHPDSAFNNISKCANAGLPVICGTTGWLEKYQIVADLVIEKESAFLYASNFSLGVNIFFALNEKLAVMMKNQSQYKVRMKETHHTQKKDAPSGTAITLADGITKYGGYEGWALGVDSDEKMIPIEAVREGDVFGRHEITYQSAVDEITLIHDAHSRAGFAQGALLAAEWIIGKKGVFSMKDMLAIS